MSVKPGRAQVGMDDFVAKPVRMEHLLGILAR